MSIFDSVVHITSSDPGRSTFGTGFVIHQSASQRACYILTCAHVVRDVGGKDNVLAAKLSASVIAFGDPDGNGVDLAILRVEELPELPALPLYSRTKEGDAISAVGFQQFNPSYLIRSVDGRLGHPIELASRGGAERTPAWDLLIKDDFALQPGYSGSPVILKGTTSVVAVVCSRIGEGVKGIAISIEGLNSIWKEDPLQEDIHFDIQRDLLQLARIEAVRDIPEHPLLEYPIGPAISAFRIPPILIETYAKLTPSSQAVTELSKAIAYRIEANPDDPEVTYPEPIYLPPPEFTAPISYWHALFANAGLHGPRMLAALLLSKPDTQFTTEAKRVRQTFLNYLKHPE